MKLNSLDLGSFFLEAPEVSFLGELEFGHQTPPNSAEKNLMNGPITTPST